MRCFILSGVLVLVAACSGDGENIAAERGEGAVIYTAAGVVTMTGPDAVTTAVAVKNGRILATGTAGELAKRLPKASVDSAFDAQVIVPGLIDPHVHVMLGALQYNLPLTPPWPMATPNGMRAGIGTREGFLAEVAAIEASMPPGQPAVIYGYHNLVHGDLTRADLDAISTERPLVIWHYSSHDFYLNSAAISRAGFTPDLARTFHGVDLDANGELTGRIYEDAAVSVLEAFADVLLAPENVSAGFQDFSRMLRAAGVTTTVEMGYGLFGWELEDANIRANWGDAQAAGYNLFLVPEYRALQRTFGDGRVEAVIDLASGKRGAAAPVLPRVKFFTDGAFFSQTMRLSPPGYLTGQSKGSEGLWVMKPDEIVPTIQPYWDAGLGVNIHSNGDAAQGATLAALKALRDGGGNNSFTIEHGGLFSPQQVEMAGRLKANVSAASHYVYYMADTYADPLGSPRAKWISPLGALTGAGAAVTLHSDAPLAPPEPLRAASVHITRATREGGTYEAQMGLTPYQALESVTLDAARAIGLEAEIGSIEAGKRADFTILGANPLTLAGTSWTDIPIWGVVLAGEKHPLDD
jgi:predicted amidohydrolase YtcJ